MSTDSRVTPQPVEQRAQQAQRLCECDADIEFDLHEIAANRCAVCGEAIA
jgi:hypothetical protein